MKRWDVIGGAVVALLGLEARLRAQTDPGMTKSAVKISDTVGGFTPRLETNDQLGRSIALLGDLDLDGVPDIASSGHSDDDGGLDRGSAYVMFLRRDGRVKATQKISLLEGGFVGPLHDGDQMGRAMACVGDLDGDGVPELALGANLDDEGGPNTGSVWILFLRRDGTVRRQAKLSRLQGGVQGLGSRDEFGRGLAGLGDFDGDGIPDLAVSAPYDDDGGANQGALYLLFLDRDARVRGQRKISETQGGFRGQLRPNDLMGFSLCNLGDFDGNGAIDLVAGAALDDDGAVNAGAIWILFLTPEGSVLRHQKISSLSGGFTGLLESPDQFGDAVAAVGDLNGDGSSEIAVGAVKDGDGGKERGAVWMLFPRADGSVSFHRKISAREGNFPYRLRNIDWLGSALSPLGDLDEDGVPDLVIGARNDDDGGSNHGALYVTCLNRVTAEDALLADQRDQRARPSLRLVRGAPAPGEELGFALDPSGSSLDQHESVLRLLLGRTRLSTTRGDGLALDPRGLLPGLAGMRELGVPGVELVLQLPDVPALAGATLWAQAVWFDLAGRVRGFSEPLELVLAPR